MTRLADVPEKAIQRLDWIELGEGLSEAIRDRVKEKHKNVNGQQFKSYSDMYEQRKTEGNAAPRGASQESKSSTPDMTLTGKTMKDLQRIRVTGKSVEIGWPVRGGVVESLAKRKNYQIVNTKGGDPFASQEMQAIKNFILDKHEKTMKKYAKKPVTIRTGR